MATSSVPVVTLNSGAKMPLIGFGTAVSEAAHLSGVVPAVLNAIAAGYRHLDVAPAYVSEQPVGEAVAEAVRRGLVRSREELFITTKLWCTDADPDLVVPALKKSLAILGLEYLDMYLVHWPVRMKKREQLTDMVLPDDILPFDVRGTWAAMEECQRLGLARSIGVSNFSCKKLSELLAGAAIPPAVNQVEVNPVWNQKKLREFSRERGIHINAYSPLGAKGTRWGTAEVMDSPVLKEIALTKGKTIAQVCLRYLYELGVSMVVKSFDRERMEQNLQILDWELSEEDTNKISEIPQKRGCRGEIFLSPAGNATLEELWDGEI